MKCFYHNDLDGRCAGAIVSQYRNNYNKEDYFEVDYVMELPLEKIQDGEEIWFVDYSFKENTMWILTNLLEKDCKIVWIDHHTSSIKLLELHKELYDYKNLNIFVFNGYSGALLTYALCYNLQFDEVPYYVKLVSDYDCWQYKYEPDTTYFKIGMESENFDALDSIWFGLYEEVENSVRYNELKTTLHRVISSGKLIKNYIDQDNTYYREHFSYESEIAGHKCLVVNKKTNSWVFGEKYSEYPLVMVWVFDGSKYTYSIFSSNEDIDCSKIAESYGGGGHKGAAGFSSTELLFKKL